MREEKRNYALAVEKQRLSGLSHALFVVGGMILHRLTIQHGQRGKMIFR